MIPVVEIKGDPALEVAARDLILTLSARLTRSAPTSPKSFMEQDESGEMEGQTEGWESIDF